MKKLLVSILLIIGLVSTLLTGSCKEQNNQSPTIEISDDGFWVINGIKTEHSALGQKGEPGLDGETPTIEISEDGFWVINGVKTEHRATISNDDTNNDDINENPSEEIPPEQENTPPTHDNPDVNLLDYGKCGDNLTWGLFEDGLLKISGTGRSYDYCKGLFGDKATKQEIETYQSNYVGKTDVTSMSHYERGFIEGKQYDHENEQYVVPWYKYRQETDFVEYTSKSVYERDNPNGWTYNRIEVEEGITYIGNWFFYRVCGPTELVLPNTVEEIGLWSIRYSPTLKKLTLPNSLKKIDKRGCSRLEAIEEIITGTGLKEIGDYAFAQNSIIKSLTINSDIEKMGTYSFGYNPCLERVEFTALKRIQQVQFVDCKKLKTVVFSDDLEVIDQLAFVNLNIETINIPEKVNDIGTSAFHGCKNLLAVYIDSPIVAKGLKYSTSFGAIASNTSCIYLKENINDIGSYLTSNFIESGAQNGYSVYNRIST
jgi:hypothetical protein